MGLVEVGFDVGIVVPLLAYLFALLRSSAVKVAEEAIVDYFLLDTSNATYPYHNLLGLV